MNYSIVITTFSKRFHYITTLIGQIRKYSDAKIYLVINGEKDGNFYEPYRKNILELSLKYDNIYPIFFTETRGLSKLWNTGIIAADQEDVLVLNDDIEIHSKDIFDFTNGLLFSSNYNGLVRINGSFSHFIIKKGFINSLGYFDERLLGFGEEDGDIIYRLAKKGVSFMMRDVTINGVQNIISDIRHDHIKPGIGKYSSFNREFIYNRKYIPNNISPYKGMFDTPMDQLLPDLDQYPYERFYKENKDKL